jgi:hypothetical protein
MNWLLILPTDFPTLRPLNIIRTLGKLKGSHLVNKIVNIATPHSQHFCAECVYMEQCLAHNNDSININPYCQCHCNRLRGILCVDSHCFMFKEFQTNIEHVFNYTGWFLSKKKKKLELHQVLKNFHLHNKCTFFETADMSFIWPHMCVHFKWSDM